MPAEEWDWTKFTVEIGDVTLANLEAALKLELDNTAFYMCAMNAAREGGNEYGWAKFKALARVEKEHAEAITKALQIDMPDIEITTCSSDFKENTQEGWDREDRAIKAYAKFEEEAPEPQMKKFFAALVEIEKDHLDLHAENLED
jgi:rubrerythrin